MNNFYVYQHRRLDTNEVFYVGKGFGDRAHKKGKHKRSKHWCNIVNKHSYVVEFVDTNLDEQTAFELEMFTIEFYGRKDLGLGGLVNNTNGGEGASGAIRSVETKSKISAAKCGDKHPLFGKTLSTETKSKMSAAKLGKTLSTETRAKISANHVDYTGDKHPRAKKVTNQFGDVFNTLTDAAKWCGLASGVNICICCNGKRKSAGKHPITGEKLIWKYFKRK